MALQCNEKEEEALLVSGTSRSTEGRVVEVKKVDNPFSGIRLENPFALKVGQVFTGFGIGCGVGIGVGRPINLGAIPVLNEVMRAGRGATNVFSGVGRHVNDSLRKVGANNIQGGVGCGVGFGHGFGVGLAVKPGVVHQIQSYFMNILTHGIMKLGIGNEMKQLLPNQSTQGPPPPLVSKNYTSQTEKVLTNFLENPLLKTNDGDDMKKLAENLKLENKLLQMVLGQQEMIEELMEANKKYRKILLKIPENISSSTPSSPCNECFECSRKQSPCSECFKCRRKQRHR